VLIAVVCALASALLYALASVWQQRAAATESSENSMRWSLLTKLATNRLWVAGIGADAAAYVAQFVALQHGSLLLVQPLLVCGLLFALPLGAHLAHARLTPRDWGGVVAVCVGLGVFLAIVGSPHDHRHPDLEGWILLLVAAAGATGLLIAATLRWSEHRAALLSASAGVVYGVAAGFTRRAGYLLAHGGLLHLLGNWSLYALIAAGAVGMLLAQSAFQSGRLDASLTPMTVVDPLVSILIGVAAFGDRVPSSPAAVVAEVSALVLMSVGVFTLAQAKAVHALHH
jgi:drug/metabolite transporter (DMT)-like permease